MTTLQDLANEALLNTGGYRNDQYGDFHTDMKLHGNIMSALDNHGLTRMSPAHRSCISLLMTKVCRIASGNKLHKDNYIDGMNYLLQAYVSEERTGDVEYEIHEPSCAMGNPTYSAKDLDAVFSDDIIAPGSDIS